MVDRNLVTSNGSLASYQAAFTLLEKMTAPAFAKKIEQNIYYDRLLRQGREGR